MEQTTGDLAVSGSQVATTVTSDSDMVKAFFGTGSKETSSQVESPTTTQQVAPLMTEEPKSEGQVNPTDETKTRDEGKDYERKATEAHKLVIDMLEDKFKSLENGRIDDAELRQWFDENPEKAQIANRSKRVKDAYRSLMERDPESRVNPETKARRDEQTKEVDNEIEDLKKSIPDGKPLTHKDFTELMEKFFEERESKQSERELKTQRMTVAEEFASKIGVVDKDFDKLIKNAEVLFNANDDFTWEDSLSAAQKALFGNKNAPVNLSAAGTNTPQVQKPASETDLGGMSYKPMVTLEQMFKKR